MVLSNSLEHFDFLLTCSKAANYFHGITLPVACGLGMDGIYQQDPPSFTAILNMGEYYIIPIYLYNKKIAFIGKQPPAGHPGKNE